MKLKDIKLNQPFLVQSSIFVPLQHYKNGKTKVRRVGTFSTEDGCRITSYDVVYRNLSSDIDVRRISMNIDPL